MRTLQYGELWDVWWDCWVLLSLRHAFFLTEVCSQVFFVSRTHLKKKNLTSIRNCHLLNVGLLSVWILLYISFTQTLFGFVVAYIHPLLPDILTRVWGRSKRETDGHLFLPSIPWHYYSSYDIIVFASFSAVVHYGSLHVRVWVCVGGCVYAFRKVCLCCFPHVISV